MIRKCHHAGIAVKDLEQALTFFEKTYGARLMRRDRYEDQQFETALIGIGELKLELLAGLHPESLVSRFIENRGEGLHHLSLEVDRFEEVITAFKNEGLKVMGETDTRDFKAAFLHPQGNLGILTEIIEPKGGWGT
ncbi:MAG: VOC family protein [Deltaproteobacteria bacterium]|nr:VOC family protein [Deltaproteobacteria bacterium]